MFSRTLTCHGQTRSFAIGLLGASGWEVRVEQNSTVTRRVLYHDWHRVERALDAMEREVRALEALGWHPLADNDERQSTNL